MLRLMVFTFLFVGPAYAALLGVVYLVRRVLPAGHVLYEQVEAYLWAPAALLALAAAGLVATLLGAS